MDGKEYGDLYASSERRNGFLTGNGAISTFNVEKILPEIPLPAYYMFYLLSHALRVLIREKIGHIERRICFFDRKIIKRDLYHVMKYGMFCLECNDKIRTILHTKEMHSVRSVIGMISDIAHANDPNTYYKEIYESLEITKEMDLNETKMMNIIFDEAIELIKVSNTEAAFDKISIIVRQEFNEKYDEIVMLSSRFNKIISEKRMGIIDTKAFSLEMNKINFELLDLIQELKKRNNS